GGDVVRVRALRRSAVAAGGSAGAGLDARRGWAAQGVLGRPRGAPARAGHPPLHARVRRLRRSDRAPGGRGRGEHPVVAAEAIAARLRAEHPDAEPQELDPGALARMVAEAGGDPDDAELVGATIVAW